LALTIPLQGTGADLVASPTTLQFGNIAFGATETVPLTVTNSGLTGTVTIGASSSGPSYTILTTAQNTCQSGITSGQSCVLPVQFSATTAGAHNGTLTLTPSGGATPVIVQVLGTASTLTASPSTLAFGTVANGASSTLASPEQSPSERPSTDRDTRYSRPRKTRARQESRQARVACFQCSSFRVAPVRITTASR
jgi:hypothetical protein